MEKQNTNDNSRRYFLLSAARLAGLSGMGVFAAATARKRRRLLRDGKCLDPQGRTGCRACGIYKECGHPRALSVKQSERG